MTGEIDPPITPGPVEDIALPDEGETGPWNGAAGEIPPEATPAAPWAGIRATSLTVADGLMLLIGGLAAVLRFGELARLPLSAAEATAALRSWEFWTASPATVSLTSPAYFTFTNLIMSLGLGGDAAARFVPAVFGLLTVLLPWLARGRARPAVYVASGLFLAVSPILVAVSRAAGGDAIALFALMALAIAWLRVGEGRAWAVAGGMALGLGLASSPLFYTGLIPFVAAAWLSGGGARLSRRDARAAAVSATAAFVLAATCVFLYPAGLGAALRLAFHWVQQFGLAGDLVSPVLALLRYEPAAVALGAVAFVWAIRRGERQGVFLVLWLALMLPLVLLQAGVMTNAAAILLPAYLLVGLLAAAAEAPHPAAGAGQGDSRWPAALAAILIVGLGALMLAAGGRIARLGLLSGEYGQLLSLAALAFGLAGIVVIASMAWDSRNARRGVLAGIGLLLIFWQWGSAMQLSRQGANDPRERWVITGTDDDVPVMVDLLRRTSRQTANSDRDLAVFSLVDSPVLRWYGRDFNDFQFGQTLPFELTADVVIAPLDIQPDLPVDYFGADFGLERHETAPEPFTLGEALKWWLFRESNAAVHEERVVAWIRSDLVK